MVNLNVKDPVIRLHNMRIRNLKCKRQDVLLRLLEEPNNSEYLHRLKHLSERIREIKNSREEYKEQREILKLYEDSVRSIATLL